MGKAILELSPAKGVMAPAKEKPRDRVLDDDELARIITAARQINSPYGGIVELLALTGQRRGSCFANEKDLPSRGVPLAPEWERLRRGISHFRNRAVLSSLMRYCSGNSISPEAVDASVLDSLMRYRAASTALAADSAARRKIARAWNSCIGIVPGWPSYRLLEPPVKSGLVGPAWEEFPEGLRRDIENYLASLGQIRRIVGGRRRPPCKPSTIGVRRAKLVAFVRKAVSIGVPIGSLTSFQELLAPDLVERVIDAYWQDNGEEPSIYTIELGSFLLDIARQTRLTRLEDMRAALEEYRPEGLTEKNMAVVRQVLGSDVWRRVVRLPWRLMEKVSSLQARSPVKAAVLAQLAVAIAILTVFPIRLGNLGAVHIDEDLIRLLARVRKARREEPGAA